MTEQQTEVTPSEAAAEPAETTAQPAPRPSPPPRRQQEDDRPDERRGSPNSVLADLKRERESRQALASEVETLREQVLASERRAVSVESGVPESMLTATDPAALRQQAAQFVEFAQAAHFAASTSQPTPPPAFQQNPGQGRGNAPLSPEAQAEAEYEKFYPSR